LTLQFIAELPIAAVVRNDQRSLLEAALSQTHTNPASDLLNELGLTLNAEQQLLLTQAMHQIAAEERGRNQVAAAVVSDETPTPTFPPLAKKAAAGTNDLVGRKLLANFTTLEEKVTKIKELGVDLPALKELTPAAKTFVVRTLGPVSRCLAGHFKGDVADFSNFWRSSFKIKFSDNCCKGVGEGPCGI
jgi:hypothetical protein